MIYASNAAINNESVPADTIADSTGSAAFARNDLFVEQQSAVQGIKELAAQLKSYLSFQMTCLQVCHLTGELLVQFQCDLTIPC